MDKSCKEDSIEDVSVNNIVDTLENDESEYINAYDQHSEPDELKNETKVIEYTEYTDQNFENRDREE